MYNLVIHVLQFGVFIASFFNKKVATMWKGECEALNLLREKVDPNAKYIWFHAASLGEFEQGRPLIERIRQEHPEYKILLTFFSPSGYEVRKNYQGADIICYLPIDTRRNAITFLRTVKPVMAFFIKYEFWYNYLHILKYRNIPTYSVSSIFRPDQVFFKWYGFSYAKVLKCFTRFFVQNEVSRELLAKLGITDVEVVGDTRFDRVLQIRQVSKHLPIVEAFKQDKKVFVAGSSWQPDEDIFIPYFNERKDWKLIIAPHVIGEDHLTQILSKLNRKAVRYTQTTPEGVGIHNVLEAAVWSVPVLFGPNNQRFQEAQGLKKSGGGFDFSSADEFKRQMDIFLSDDGEEIRRTGKAAGEYVESLAGASQKIIDAVSF